jgi:hypothetical protein
MLEQAVHASEALQEAARNTSRPLVPALSGCKACQTVHMSASPVLGRCIDCGAELDVLHRTEPAVRHG